MKSKKVLLSLIILMGIIATVTYINRYFTSLGTFIFSFSVSFCGVLIGIYFSKKKAFNAWKKFAMFYLPISIVLIMLSPTTNMNFIGFDKELTTLWLAGIFFIISIIIILAKREKHGVLEEEEC